MSKPPARSGRRPGEAPPLRYREDIRTLGFMGVLIGLYVVQWFAIYRHWILLVAACLLAFTACVIKHNHIHCRTFSRRSWNIAFNHLLGFCTGQSTTALISIHNERHHRKNNTHEDCVRAEQLGLTQNWLNLLVFPIIVVARVRRARPHDIERWRHQNPVRFWRARWEALTLVAFILAAASVDWRATALYLGLPWLFGNWGIVTINLLQHQDCDPASKHDHSRNVTGTIANWLFLNNGYHTAHHERPSLHWSRLKNLHDMRVAPFIRPELNESSLARSVWRRFILGSREIGTRVEKR